jgi:hypothetical protein
MSLGYNHEENVVNLNDSARLVAVIYNDEDEPYLAADITSVSFEIAKPDNTRVTSAGAVQADGSGLLLFNATDVLGPYIALATFTLTPTHGSQIKSTRVDFEVVDPFMSNDPSQSYIVALAAWGKIEDCFDTEDDGPWLRDMTNTYFTKEKMENFIDEALFFINQANPPTALGVGSFVTGETPPTPTADLPLLAQGTFIMVLRHLIRSYVEQPNPVGAQIAWHDRRDYLQRWQTVLQIEQAAFDKMLALYKRRFLGLGHSKVLVATKAGRLVGSPMRSRFVGRGYW